VGPAVLALLPKRFFHSVVGWTEAEEDVAESPWGGVGGLCSCAQAATLNEGARFAQPDVRA